MRKDFELLDLFPQDSEEEESLLDVILGCQQPVQAHHLLIQAFIDRGYKCELVQGEFDLGYMTSIHRPKMLILAPDMISLSLVNLSQRLSLEPLTAHIKLIPLISADGEVAIRRRKQIDKIGLQPYDWDPQNPTNIVESLDLALKA